jgi:hypothetical protein
MDFKEIGCEDADLMQLTEDRDQLTSSWRHGNDSGFIKGGEFLDYLGEY